MYCTLILRRKRAIASLLLPPGRRACPPKKTPPTHTRFMLAYACWFCLTEALVAVVHIIHDESATDGAPTAMVMVRAIRSVASCPFPLRSPRALLLALGRGWSRAVPCIRTRDKRLSSPICASACGTHASTSFVSSHASPASCRRPSASSTTRSCTSTRSNVTSSQFRASCRTS